MNLGNKKRNNENINDEKNENSNKKIKIEENTSFSSVEIEPEHSGDDEKIKSLKNFINIAGLKIENATYDKINTKKKRLIF